MITASTGAHRSSLGSDFVLASTEWASIGGHVEHDV